MRRRSPRSTASRRRRLGKGRAGGAVSVGRHADRPVCAPLGSGGDPRPPRPELEPSPPRARPLARPPPGGTPVLARVTAARASRDGGVPKTTIRRAADAGSHAGARCFRVGLGAGGGRPGRAPPGPVGGSAASGRDRSCSEQGHEPRARRHRKRGLGKRPRTDGALPRRPVRDRRRREATSPCALLRRTRILEPSTRPNPRARSAAPSTGLGRETRSGRRPTGPLRRARRAHPARRLARTDRPRGSARARGSLRPVRAHPSCDGRGVSLVASGAAARREVSWLRPGRPRRGVSTFDAPAGWAGGAGRAPGSIAGRPTLGTCGS